MSINLLQQNTTSSIVAVTGATICFNLKYSTLITLGTMASVSIE